MSGALLPPQLTAASGVEAALRKRGHAVLDALGLHVALGAARAALDTWQPRHAGDDAAGGWISGAGSVLNGPRRLATGPAQSRIRPPRARTKITSMRARLLQCLFDCHDFGNAPLQHGRSACADETEFDRFQTPRIERSLAPMRPRRRAASHNSATLRP